MISAIILAISLSHQISARPSRSELLESHNTKAANKNLSPKIDSGRNLPAFYSGRQLFTSEESHIILPQGKQFQPFNEIRIGEVIEAEIPESVIAFQNSKTPVRGLIKLKNSKSYLFLGEASLDETSKRINISFLKLRAESENQIWDLKGSAMDHNGIAGVEGKLFSNEDKYFLAQLLTAAASGATDASISRSENSLGNQVEQKSLDTVSKKALVGALSKTADIFSDKLKKAPEYSVLQGPIKIKILITDYGKAID